MKKRLFILSTIAIALCSGTKAANPNVLDLKHSISDSTIIYPESFEADTQKLLEGWYMQNYTSTDDAYRNSKDVEVSDEVYIQRLKKMPTIIEMPFNQVVKNYIQRYTMRGRAQVAAILGLSHYYMPIFEQALEAEGLPLELKYLPIVESGLDPNAVSKHGAAGLWQFMLATAKGLGLEVNSLVDERRDPYRSTERAVAYLKDLYQTYGDWTLAIAAYNCGPSEVNKAIRRAGGDPKSHDFWSIYNYLRPETRGYVPMFIAANYVMNYHNEHNINPVLATKPLVTDTIAVNKRVHFQQISDVLDIPVEELRILNPQFRADIIPGTADDPYFLILPSQQIHSYLLSEQQIIEHDADKYAQRDVVEPDNTAGGNNADTAANSVATETFEPETTNDVAVVQTSVDNKKTGSRAVTHKVKAGESLASIAEQYGVSPTQIKDWNHLRRNSIRTGQQLRIVTDEPTVRKNETVAQNTNRQRQNVETQKTTERRQTAQSAGTDKPKKDKNKRDKERQTSKKKNKQHNKSYTVKNGDSLDRIAHRNGVSVNQLRTANGISGSTIQPGQKLVIPSKNAPETTKKSKKRNKRRR